MIYYYISMAFFFVSVVIVMFGCFFFLLSIAVIFWCWFALYWQKRASVFLFSFIFECSTTITALINAILCYAHALVYNFIKCLDISFITFTFTHFVRCCVDCDAIINFLLRCWVVHWITFNNNLFDDLHIRKKNPFITHS